MDLVPRRGTREGRERAGSPLRGQGVHAGLHRAPPRPSADTDAVVKKLSRKPEGLQARDLLLQKLEG